MTPDVSNAPPLSICKLILKDLGFIDPGVSATYIVTVTLDQSIIDSAQELYNQVTANIEFVTPSGLTVTMTSVSDDPSTPAKNDPTFTNLDNLKGIEVIKEVQSISDTNGNSLTDAGDVITYKATIKNIGQTNLADFEITDILQTSTGTKTIQISDPLVGIGQNYFDYSWVIEDNQYGWLKDGNITASSNGDDNYGSIPYKIVDYYGATNSWNYSYYIDGTFTFPYNQLPNSGTTNNNDDRHTYMHYLYSNNDDDAYVYKNMRLKPNTTYTISVYGKKNAAAIAPWHFVIHDGMDTNYNWADAIKSQDFELEQTTISQ